MGARSGGGGGAGFGGGGSSASATFSSQLKTLNAGKSLKLQNGESKVTITKDKNTGYFSVSKVNSDTSTSHSTIGTTTALEMYISNNNLTAAKSGGSKSGGFKGYSTVNKVLQGKTSSSKSSATKSTSSKKGSTKTPKYTSTGHRIGMKTFSPKSNAGNWNNWQWGSKK